jgi:amino acid transporter
MKRQLTVLQLTGIIYFTVSGGAFGLEEPIAAAGPGLALLLLIITPIFWSVPIALVTAELSTMLPIDGGYYRWVYLGLGRFWGFLEGWWTWLFTFIDMAIYPVLFTTYLKFFFPGMTRWQQWLICLLVIFSSLIINLRGAKSVGNSAVLAFIVVTVPFLLLTVVSIPQITHLPWQPFAPHSGARTMDSIGVGLSALMWSYMGWDNVSTFAGEVKNPGRTFPLSLILAVLLVTLLYVLPVAAALGVTSNWREWNTDTFTISHVASQIAGPWLGALISFGIMWSLWSLFNSQLLYTSRLPFAMAEDGLLPRVLTITHSRYDTPWVSLVLCSIIYSLFSLLSFAELVVVDVIIYSIALLLEYAALIVLRLKRPHLPRPFRIPGGWLGIALSLASLLLFAGAVTFFTVADATDSRKQMAIAGGLLLSGPFIYFFRQQLGKIPPKAAGNLNWQSGLEVTEK